MSHMSVSPLFSCPSNNCHIAEEHPTLRVGEVVRVISVCDRTGDVWPDPLQQVVLGWGVIIPHHQVVLLPLLPVSPGVHDVDVVKCEQSVSVRLKAWCSGALTLAAEMEGVTSSLAMKYIPCCLPVEKCVAPPLHHPGVHTHTLQHLVQHLRQMVKEGRY